MSLHGVRFAMPSEIEGVNVILISCLGVVYQDQSATKASFADKHVHAATLPGQCMTHCLQCNNAMHACMRMCGGKSHQKP